MLRAEVSADTSTTNVMIKLLCMRAGGVSLSSQEGTGNPGQKGEEGRHRRTEGRQTSSYMGKVVFNETTGGEMDERAVRTEL